MLKHNINYLLHKMFVKTAKERNIIFIQWQNSTTTNETLSPGSTRVDKYHRPYKFKLEMWRLTTFVYHIEAINCTLDSVPNLLILVG
jgi:hypothetical protein